MTLVAIDETKTARVVIYCPLELLRRVNLWRARRGAESSGGKIPSQSAALAELIEQALAAAEREDHEREKKL